MFVATAAGDMPGEQLGFQIFNDIEEYHANNGQRNNGGKEQWCVQVGVGAGANAL